jgi:hypothetical protein
VWFCVTLLSLPVSARVFVCISKVGYVGVGTVTAEARRLDDSVVSVDSELSELPLQGRYQPTDADDEETAEYVVPFPGRDPAARAGAMAARNVRKPECRLQAAYQFTIDTITAAFGLVHDEPRNTMTSTNVARGTVRMRGPWRDQDLRVIGGATGLCGRKVVLAS